MLGGGFRLGRILGFTIRVDWSWLLIFVLVVFSLAGGYFPRFYPQFGIATNWLVGMIAAVLLFASVLAHELMHSIVARRGGIDVKEITLFIFGGVSQTKSEPDDPWMEFRMALAGPALSIALAVGFWVLARITALAMGPAPVVALFGYLAFINLILGLFNLAPGFPLDGGRVLRSVIWAVTDDLEKATRFASYAGQAFAYFLIVIGFINITSGILFQGLWLVFIGWFLSSAARSGYEQVVVRQALTGMEVRDIMVKDTPSVAPEVTVDHFVHDYLLRHDYSMYPVVEGDVVKGVVGIAEVRKLPKDRWESTPVSDIAYPVDEERKVRKEDDAWQALTQLMTTDGSRLLVMDNGHLDGMVTRENLFHLVQTKMRLGV